MRYGMHFEKVREGGKAVGGGKQGRGRERGDADKLSKIETEREGESSGGRRRGRGQDKEGLFCKAN